MKVIIRLWHELLCLLGFETKPVTGSATVSSGLVTKSADGSEKVVKEPTNQMTTKTTFAKKSHLWVAPRMKRVGVSLKLILLLLVVREFCPNAVEAIQPVYDFLDAVMLPVINWVYRIGLKVVYELLEMEFFAHIIQFLNNLAL